MKKMIFIIIILFLFVVNFTPITYILKENYSFSNFDGSFNIQEEPGINFLVVKKRHQRFLLNNPDKKAADLRLYRTFTIKPWFVWQWGDYIFQNERFRLPYKDPKK